MPWRLDPTHSWEFAENSTFSCAFSVTNHDINGLSSVDFVVTFQRGTEWAATGNVTQKVPADFPTAEMTSLRAP